MSRAKTCIGPQGQRFKHKLIFHRILARNARQVRAAAEACCIYYDGWHTRDDIKEMKRDTRAEYARLAAGERIG